MLETVLGSGLLALLVGLVMRTAARGPDPLVTVPLPARPWSRRWRAYVWYGVVGACWYQLIRFWFAAGA
jgi:hypothetical protein